MPGRYCYDYPRPALAADTIVVSDGGSVLLVRRKHEPFKGHWAIPGGFVEIDEPLEHAARRELEEETGLTGVELTQLRTFGTPGRDPRGRTVSVVFLATVKGRPGPQAGSDAAEARWFPLDALPPVAFDHAEVIAVAREALGPRP